MSRRWFKPSPTIFFRDNRTARRRVDEGGRIFGVVSFARFRLLQTRLLCVLFSRSDKHRTAIKMIRKVFIVLLGCDLCREVLLSSHVGGTHDHLVDTRACTWNPLRLWLERWVQIGRKCIVRAHMLLLRQEVRFELIVLFISWLLMLSIVPIRILFVRFHVRLLRVRLELARGSVDVIVTQSVELFFGWPWWFWHNNGSFSVDDDFRFEFWWRLRLAALMWGYVLACLSVLRGGSRLGTVELLDLKFQWRRHGNDSWIRDVVSRWFLTLILFHLSSFGSKLDLQNLVLLKI